MSLSMCRVCHSASPALAFGRNPEVCFLLQRNTTHPNKFLKAKLWFKCLAGPEELQALFFGGWGRCSFPCLCGFAGLLKPPEPPAFPPLPAAGTKVLCDQQALQSRSGLGESGGSAFPYSTTPHPPTPVLEAGRPRQPSSVWKGRLAGACAMVFCC